MARRNRNELLGNSVQIALTCANVSAETLSKAADLRTSELRTRLSGEVAFTLRELSKVGGFLRVPVSALVEGI